MRNKRAYTLIEVLIAAVVLLYASLAFYSIYAVTTRQEIHSQFLSLADFTANSLLEEVDAHRYGMPPPRSWGIEGGTSPGKWQDLDYDIWIDGKKVKSSFHVQWFLKNGSFVGASHESQDVVTIVISWAEGVGEDPPYGEFSKVYFQGDDRHLVVQVPVWK